MPIPHLLSPQGFRAAGVYAGIKTRKTPDVGVLVCDTLATAAAAFTTNKVVSPGVIVGQKHIAGGRLRGVVVNAGNANTCTGAQGYRDAIAMCRIAAEGTGTELEQFLPSSTGIIGHRLPMAKLEPGIASACDRLGSSASHAADFAAAILTTDLKRKAHAVRFRVGKQWVTVAGVCKGSGMIGPRMAVGGLHATMLGYLTTDAAIGAATLRKLLGTSVDQSFNCVTVDDQASTNDTVCVLASGLGARIDSTSGRKSFASGLDEVCRSLAYQIAADGEGATKVVVVKVRGAKSTDDARLMARTIANSPLVKCAMNGNDPNWGRVMCAAGFSGASLEPERCVLRLQGTVVFSNAGPAKYDPAKVSRLLKSREVTIDLDIRLGRFDATVWTCDLSKEYVKINADYHT